jgi:HAD superfamily hydrolase (TIGR01509 family)
VYLGVVWDFDGTLYDTYTAIMKALTQTLQEINVTFDQQELYRTIKEGSVHGVLEKYAAQQQLAAPALVAHYHDIEQQYQSAPQPLPSALAACQAVVAAGGQNFLLTHRDRSALAYLKNDGLLDLFTDFVTSDQAFKRKPDPESLNYLVDKYDLPREQTLMVGDRLLDVQAGINAGVQTCFYDIDGFHNVSQATITIQQLSDLIPYFQNTK